MRNKCLYLFFLVIVLLLVVGCSPEPAPPTTDNDEEVVDFEDEEAVDFEPVTLRFATAVGSAGVKYEAIQWLVDEIEERTEGRVSFDIHWDATMMQGGELLRGVMSGAADVGDINVAFFPSALHSWQVFNSFLTGPESLHDQLVLKNRVIDEVPAFHAELERWNQVPITHFAFQYGTIGTTQPLTSLDDVQGLQIRAPSYWLLTMLEAAGAVPVSVPYGEIHTALDRGTIDGVYTSIDTFHVNFWDEITRHFLWHPRLWMAHPHVITMNKDTWDSLLEEDRQTIIQVGLEVQERQTSLDEEAIQDEIAEMEDRSDAVFTIATDEEINEWNNHPMVQELPDTWAEEAEEQGVPGEQIIETIREIMSEME